ncbi:MAG: amino acid adenylation domain-containing protein [Acidobacteriota bacterium]|nr:amino acid adenylation domain-containing protein [Acidobacteriota bacterium]
MESSAWRPELILPAALHRIAQQHRDRPAVRAAGGELTYGELNRRASRLARRLRRVGVGPEVIVGIALERSLELVVAQLAVLQAGGAYLGLDPEHPEERRAFMIEDSGAPVVLGRRGGIAPPEGFDGVWMTVDEDAGGEDSDLAPEEARATPDNLAYVIYTSGSTGKPKGVALTHSGIQRLVLATELVRLGPGDRVGQTINTSFDVSTLEIWGALLTGATLVLADPAVVRDARRMAAWLRSGEITTLMTVTALFNEVVREDPAAFSGLDTVYVGGEAADPRRMAEVLAAGAPGRLFNAYGPTESTAISVAYQVEEVAEGSTALPIGRPVEGTEALLRGPRLQPMTANEGATNEGNSAAGELLLAGDGLARGYLGRPAATAAAFVPHPEATTPGQRAYRTGDLALWTENGELEFAGRIDHQVKVRGYRVELGEIEQRLGEHPQVAAAVVTARETAAGRGLAAYVVPEASESAPDLGNLDLAQLGRWLGERLPEYMVPAVFVPLDQLPLTAHGKVDRDALPDPGPAARPVSTPFVAPRGELEERLAALWCELLEMTEVGVDDSLFALGGNSLLATRLAARVRDELGRELPLEAVFDRPTIAGWAQALEQSADDLGEDETPPPRSQPRPDRVPPTSPQQRVWFLQELDPGSLAYQAQAMIHLRGDLDVRAFQRSLSEIVRRHESLRTSFPSVEGHPVQRIHPPRPVPLTLIDLTALPEAERPQRSRQIMESIYRNRFDMGQVPLVRWVLFRMAEDYHRVLHVEHHMIHDGWSFNVFLEELGALYGVYREDPGAESPLPPLPIQFADFALWQQRWLEGPAAQRQLDFWRQRLTPAPEVLPLPLDRPRPRAQTFRGTTLRWELEGPVAAGVRDLARSSGMTVFMVLLSGFFTFLHRLTGHHDLTVGSGVANRRYRSVEGLIGMIINTLVMRADTSGDPSFGALLSAVSRSAAQAYAHQDLPFERIVETLRPERDASYNPFFQVMFSFHDAPLGQVQLPGLELDLTVALPNGSAKFDFNSTVILPREQRVASGAAESEDAITFLWEINTDLFDPTTVQRWIGQYQQLLAGAVADPSTRLSRLPLLPAGEAHQLRVEWNDTGAEEPAPRVLHRLIVDQARRTPEAVAVVGDEESLTYGQLEERSARLAAALRELGAGLDTPVALAMERSPELLVALLAILRSGAAYAPLDPDYPAQRLAAVVEDVRAPLLLAHSATVDRVQGLAGGEGPRLVTVEELAAASSENASDGPPEETSEEEALAYIIHTSGSTGRPKGVMNRHRSIVNRLRWMQRTFGLSAEDAVLQKTPLSFDVSVWELFWPLITGARLVLATPGGHKDPSYLARRIAEEGVTTLHFVPSMLRLFLEADGLEESCAGLRRVVASGEALEPDLVERFHQRMSCPLHNLYGPTEAAVDVTHWPCSDAVGRSVPIGRPVDNTSIFVLDPAGGPRALGTAGELCIGGVQLARGYYRRPAMTAERFVPDGHSGTAGGRLYRTGDLARWRPDGVLEFLGRIDHQVKVRGFRVELGEIEAVLGSHPAVRDAAVALTREKDDLVGCVVLREGEDEETSLDQVREHLRQRLPDYMVPALLRAVKEIPLSPNGKVDRRMLAELAEGASRRRRAEYLAPRTEMEELLHTIWTELITAPRIGVLDNFFDLGGHSLHATRHMYRVRELLEVELPVRALYEAPTIAEMAILVESRLMEELEAMEG